MSETPMMYERRRIQERSRASSRDWITRRTSDQEENRQEGVQESRVQRRQQPLEARLAFPYYQLTQANHMNLYTKALVFAATKHAGQKRHNGNNYIIHPIRVSQEVKSEAQKVIALLHDTVEDTDTTLEEIVLNFGSDVGEAIEALTRRKGELYYDYIQRVKQNPDAVAVKISDICDNLSDTPSDKSVMRCALGITELVC